MRDMQTRHHNMRDMQTRLDNRKGDSMAAHYGIRWALPGHARVGDTQVLLLSLRNGQLVLLDILRST